MKLLFTFLMISTSLFTQAQNVDHSDLRNIILNMAYNQPNLAQSLNSQNPHDSNSNDLAHEQYSFQHAIVGFCKPTRLIAGISMKSKSPLLPNPISIPIARERLHSFLSLLANRVPCEIIRSSLVASDDRLTTTFHFDTKYGPYKFSRKGIARVDRSTGDIENVRVGLLPRITDIPYLLVNQTQAQSEAMRYMRDHTAFGPFTIEVTFPPMWHNLKYESKSVLLPGLINMSEGELSKAGRREAFLCYMFHLIDSQSPEQRWVATIDAVTGKFLIGGPIPPPGTNTTQLFATEN